MSVRRPALRYHGGKWMLAPWIIEHFPAHRIYVEPYGGAASVLLRKSRAYAEIYNDLSDQVVNLFEVLRDPMLAERLAYVVAITPFSRIEFGKAKRAAIDPVENARRLLVRSHMGFGTDSVAIASTTGFRSVSNRSGTTPAHDWAAFPSTLAGITERLRGVVIEHRPAIRVMQSHDGPDTLHYVDPPYVFATRGKRTERYTHEMTDDDHRELASALHRLGGMVVLSGYRCALYDGLFEAWKRYDIDAYADGARARTESLWLSPRAVGALHPRLIA